MYDAGDCRLHSLNGLLQLSSKRGNACEAKFIIFRRVKLLMTSFDKHFLLARFMCSLVWDVDANSSASSAYQLFIVSHEIPNISKA